MRARKHLVAWIAGLAAGCDAPTFREQPGSGCVNTTTRVRVEFVDDVSVSPATGVVATLGSTSVSLRCEAPGTYTIELSMDGNARHPTATFVCEDCGVEGCTTAEDAANWAWYHTYVMQQGSMMTASDGVSTGESSGATDAVCVTYGTAEARRAVPVECGEEGVTCAAGAQPLTGEVATIAVEYAADVPASDADNAYQYGFVFETDDDATNDWEPLPAYPNDTYQGTDLWVQLTANAGGPWTVGVDDVTSSQQIVRRATSDARVVRDGSVLVMMVPLADLGPAPAFRTTAFRHDGQWLQGDWNIDYYPETDTLLPFEE